MDSTPIKRQDEREASKRGAHSGRDVPEWVTRHVTIGHSSSATSTRDAGPAHDATDAELELIRVHGHLKRQMPRARQRALTKWIYVAEYSARRWGARRPLRVVVNA